MSYQQSSSSLLYQNSFDEGAEEYGTAYGGNSGDYTSYEASSTTGYGVGGGKTVPGGFNQQGFPKETLTNGGGYNSSSFKQQTASKLTDAQGLFNDPNPQLIRRPAVGDPQVFTQQVSVRFLQPPALPPPGPLIIKEVRPPQRPPPPPLYIRQRPPPPAILPPIVIREAPPKVPIAVGTQVISKMLPPLPVPPRSVIIERLPPLPPKPRDVIVERWLPYRTQQKRRVIIQRAPPAVVQKPRNIIIYYEPPRTRVVRRFENLGVQLTNPTDYVAQYGSQLEDAQTLLRRARQAGVVEDITPPAGTVSNFQSSNYENYQSSGTSAIPPNNYGLSSSYSTTGSAAGLGSTSGGFGFVNNTNGRLGESYSSQQAYS